SVQNPSSTRMYVMDLMNYNFYQLALPYQALYVSEVRTAQDFNIPIPPSNGKETTWYLVFQNPNNQLIYVTCRAGVNYERAFLGHPYTEWISRACIVIAPSYTVWTMVSKRYEIRVVPEPKSRRNLKNNE
ncbi:hypothetical protein MUP77_10275, partial [Candidatus Bathyarchaeota archaeon]|nr:hypothetical protein [Candidatus Bathyarchaeota archaeon]